MATKKKGTKRPPRDFGVLWGFYVYGAGLFLTFHVTRKQAIEYGVQTGWYGKPVRVRITEIIK